MPVIYHSFDGDIVKYQNVFRTNEYISFNASSCITCGACEDVCPQGAISLLYGANDSWNLELSNCDTDGRCAAVCPVNAIEVMNPQCDDEVESQIANSYPVVENVVIQNLSGGDSKTRFKGYKWTFHRQGLAPFPPLWKCVSYELGKHKRVENTDDWEWEDISHQSASLLGEQLFGKLSVEVNLAVPVVGKVISGMQLVYTLIAEVECAGFPIAGTFEFQNQNMFNVTDVGIG